MLKGFVKRSSRSTSTSERYIIVRITTTIETFNLPFIRIFKVPGDILNFPIIFVEFCFRLKIGNIKMPNVKNQVHV